MCTEESDSSECTNVTIIVGSWLFSSLRRGGVLRASLAPLAGRVIGGC